MSFQTHMAYSTNRKNGKLAAASLSVVYGLDDLIRIIRNLGNENNVRTAGHTGIKCKPSDLMSHNFHKEYPSV